MMVAPNIRYAIARQRGAYVLEFGVVIFGVAVFLVGLSDIARIFHARGAVRAGVTEGLRCLYPTDAGCVQGSQRSGSVQPPRFTALVWGQGFLLPRSSYQALASWFNEPVMEASFESTRLAQVDVQRHRDPYREYQVTFPVAAYSPYLLKTRDLPAVILGAGATAGARVRNARFVDRFTRAERPPDMAIGLAQRMLSTGEAAGGTRVLVERISFNLRDAWTAKGVDISSIKAVEDRYRVMVPCFQGPKAASGSVIWPTGGYPERCSYQAGSNNLYANRDVVVPLMLHVTGRGYVTSNRIAGGISLMLEYSTQPGYRLELGGQSITHVSRSGRQEWQPANFVPRGVRVTTNSSDIRGELSSRYDAGSSYLQACREAGYAECEEPRYMTLPLIPLDAQVTLSVFVEWNRRANGAISNETVAWDGGELRVFYPRFELKNESGDCGYTTQPGTCPQPPSAFRMLYHDVDLSRTLSHAAPAALSCSRSAPSNIFPSSAVALDYFRTSFLSQQRAGQALSASSFALLSQAAGDVAQCPALSSTYVCNDDFKQHLKGCPPTFDDSQVIQKCNLNDVRVSTDRLRSTLQTVSSQQREERGKCSQEPFPACATPFLSPGTDRFLGLTGGDCVDARRVTNPTENFGPLFDYRAESTCPDVEGSIKEWYREKYGVPSQIPVIVERGQSQPAAAQQEPVNRCQIFYPVDADDSTTMVCAENVRRHVAERCCSNDPSRCEIIALQEAGGSSSGSEADVLLAAAKERVEDTVMVAYPPAQRGDTCDQTTPHCLKVSAELDPDVTEARIKASMPVPLALMNWFGRNNRTTITYEESRLLESALSGSGL